MPLQVFDRINDINGPKLRSMPHDKYFGEMRLTDEQKKGRIALAEKLEDVMMFLFYLIIAQNLYGNVDEKDIKQSLYARIRNSVGSHVEITPEIDSEIKTLSEDTTDTTLEHVPILLAISNDKPMDEKKKESEKFYMSDDRARFLGQEWANTIFAYSDYEKAIRAGFREKMWLSMRDPFVRPTHQRVDGHIVPIKELFMVGNSFMRFPRDQKYGASMREIASCRCTIKFIK